MITSHFIRPILLTATANGATQIGVYNWGGVYPHSVAEGVETVAALGGSVARIALSARTPIDYHTGRPCMNPFSLLVGVQSQDLTRSISNSRISTFIITAYDGLTFDCTHTRFLNPAFFTREHTAELQQEYSDFTLFLL